MRFSPEFLDDLKSRLRLSDVIGRSVRLKKQGREWAGLSPFTKEKTPSFFVNEEKGFYHCFSTGKHGDLISFLQETESLSFHEAVERLAGEAGVELPKDSFEDREQQKKRNGLVEACEAAADYFQQQLRRVEGRDAREYLERRGLGPDMIETFRLGFAPNLRNGLKDTLVNKGFSLDVLVEAGLLIKPDDGGAPYDRFRGRIMFPILGPRENVIAFGGRAMDKNARAKYLNSPETPLFHKGAVLYNLTAARKAADKDKPIIVCEGYMDVIAVTDAGFAEAVAPLGTAMTERQMELLWRVSDEPLVCFDGDKAGLGAAHRAIDRVLPILKPGRSLQFVFLPDGQDPDDLIRASGPAAFAETLGRARPLIDVLWEREISAQPLTTPERRAAFKSHLRTLTKTIADKDVRTAYGEELARRLDDLFGAAKKQSFNGARGGQKGAVPAWRGGAQRPSMVRRPAAAACARREALLTLTLARHPALLEAHAEAFADLPFQDREMDALRRVLLDYFAAGSDLDTDALKRHVHGSDSAKTFERIDKDRTLNLEPFARPDAALDEAETGWLHTLSLHQHEGVLRDELQDAVADLARDMSSQGERRLRSVLTQRASAIAKDDAAAPDPGPRQEPMD